MRWTSFLLLIAKVRGWCPLPLLLLYVTLSIHFPPFSAAPEVNLILVLPLSWPVLLQIVFNSATIS